MNIPLLRRTLFVNGVCSLALGLLQVAFADTLGRLTGYPPLALRVVGLGLVPFAAGVLALARDPASRSGLVRAVFAADVAWVLGTAVLLPLVPATTLGRIAALDVGLLVAAFAWFERRGLATRPAVAVPS